MNIYKLFTLITAMLLVSCGDGKSGKKGPIKLSSTATPPKPGSPSIIAEINLELMPIPAGSFSMGSPIQEQDRQDDEGPQTIVTITKPFWLSNREVTQDQWEAVMGNNPSIFKGKDLPVEKVSWDDAIAFCKKLNQDLENTLPDGYRYTLPTEAQWEYACRAKSTTRFYFGDDPEYDQLDKYAWYAGNSMGKTHTVGIKLPNRWDLYDMHGNVWEWCLDWYGDYTGGAASDPQGAESGDYRVLRGGGWHFDGLDCRVADRNWAFPNGAFSLLGFRVALSSVPAE